MHPLIFSLIAVVAGYLLYRYGYFRGVMDAKELREEIEKIQNG